MLQLRYQFVRILGEIVDWRDAQKYRPKRPGILCWKSFNRRALFRAGFARPLEDVRVGTSPALPIKLAEIATGAGKVNAKEHAVKADVKISQQTCAPHALGFRSGKTPAKSTLLQIFRALDIDAFESIFCCEMHQHAAEDELLP